MNKVTINNLSEADLAFIRALSIQYKWDIEEDTDPLLAASLLSEHEKAELTLRIDEILLSELNSTTLSLNEVKSRLAQ